MTGKVIPLFIDICFENKYIIRLNRVGDSKDGKPVYGMMGTAEELARFQEDIDSVYPREVKQ